MDKNIKQQAECICTNLWIVQTTNTFKRNTLVSAETAKEAKGKVLLFLSGNKEIFVWPQHTRE